MTVKLLDEVDVGVDFLIVLVLGLGGNWAGQQDDFLFLSPPRQALRTALASSSVEDSKSRASSPALMSSSPGHSTHNTRASSVVLPRGGSGPTHQQTLKIHSRRKLFFFMYIVGSVSEKLKY